MGQGIEGLWHALSAIAADLEEIKHGVEWLFVPSHWVRLFCFVLGTAALIPGLNSLRHAGSGDFSLAVGIILITVAGILYFLAFHNLPSDVTDLRGLLGYISEGIRTRQPPGLTEAEEKKAGQKT